MLQSKITLKKNPKIVNGFVCGLVSFIPPVYLAWMASRYGVDVPFWDEWALLPLIEKIYKAALSFHDLWAPHNEHRIFFPKIILLMLAYFTKWNVSYEIAVNVLLGAGAFGVLVLLIKKTSFFIHRDRNVLNWIIPAVSFLVFSLNQWGNWLWGWQMQIFLCVFSSVAGLAALAQPEFLWRRFVLAVCLGIVATFSFAGGICYWIAGLVVLCFMPGEDKKRKRIVILSWLCVVFATMFLYFFNYTLPDNEAGSQILTHPAEYIYFVLIYLGSPLENFNVFYAGLTGFLGALLTCYVTWLVIKEWKVSFHVFLPYLSLCVFSLSNAMLTGAGRVNRGIEQALSYQYVTVSYLFWIGILVFLHPVVVSHFENQKGYRQRKYALYGVYAAILYLMLQSSLHGSRSCMTRYLHLSRARYALAQSHRDSDMAVLHPDMQFVKKSIPLLKKYGLSVYRENEK